MVCRYVWCQHLTPVTEQEVQLCVTDTRHVGGISLLMYSVSLCHKCSCCMSAAETLSQVCCHHKDSLTVCQQAGLCLLRLIYSGLKLQEHSWTHWLIYWDPTVTVSLTQCYYNSVKALPKTFCAVWACDCIEDKLRNSKFTFLKLGFYK